MMRAGRATLDPILNGSTASIEEPWLGSMITRPHDTKLRPG